MCGSLEMDLGGGRIGPGKEDEGRHVRREAGEQRGKAVEVGVERVPLWRGKRPVWSRNL